MVITMQILIVDDDIPTVEAIRDSIDWQSIGIRAVKAAHSAAQAKRILEEKDIDIVVSDIEMPRGSGLDLLEWIRKQGIEAEFILLTCHEKFDYAASAIKHQAAEYLVKPYDSKIMELSIKKAVAKIMENKRLRENSRYNEWASHNIRQEQLCFWLSIYSGIVKPDRERIQCEIEARKLPINANKLFRLVMTKITDYEQQLEELGADLLYFSLENIHSRILSGREENRCVIRRTEDNGLWLFTTVEDEQDVNYTVKCEKVVAECNSSVRVKVTCCIGDPCYIEELHRKAVKLERLIQHSVMFYGRTFTEKETIVSSTGESQVMDIEKLTELLRKHDKISLLNYLKEMLQCKTDNKTLDERSLYLMKQEILQAIYAHLLQNGIQATRLFYDETSIMLSNKASQSSLDMLRWVNYLLERSFDYEEEIAKAGTFIQKINAYIRENYQENIDRKKLAEVFYLAPDYLAKLYHKKTGKYLNDYINEYRMERAKELLRRKDTLVCDVARAVGIDNYTYFSTMFKKFIGVTPNEYRQNCQ